MKTNIKALMACSVLLASVGTVSAAPGTLVHKVITYNLPAGGTSQAYNLPANKPVAVLGTQLTSGYRGVGQVTILRIPNEFLEWVGVESPSSSVITKGFSSTPGTHILYLDYDHQVDIQVNGPNGFVIKNASSGRRTGQVTLTYTK